eukprot:scaffold46974_cov39-Cyclotella_meneghiniana.AAC.3
MKLSIIACTLFASLLSTVSAGSVNINNAPPYVGCQRNCAAVYVKDRNLANLKQCHSGCFTNDYSKAEPVANENEGKPVQEENSSDNSPGSRRARSVNINDAPPYVGCQRVCASVYVKDRNLANLKQCHSDCFTKDYSKAEPVANETEGKPEQEDNSSENSPGSRRQLWSPAILPPGDSPDDDTWGRIPPAVRCQSACFQFAANYEKFNQCTRDCLSNQSNVSQLNANETEDQNDSVKKSNLRGSDNAN